MRTVITDLQVSFHALVRFRQRYLRPEEQMAIGNEVAAQWLNGLVREAVGQQRYEDVLDEGLRTRVVELRPRRPGMSVSYVVIRDLDTSGATIVTLLSAWMRDTNRRTRWRSLDGEALMGTPTGRTGALRVRLGDVARGR